MLNIIAAQQEVANINSSYRLAIQQVVINILFTSNYTEKSEYNRIKYWGKFLSVLFRSVSYVLVLSFYLGSSLLLKIIFLSILIVFVLKIGITFRCFKIQKAQKYTVKSILLFLVFCLAPLPGSKSSKSILCLDKQLYTLILPTLPFFLHKSQYTILGCQMEHMTSS